MSDKIYEMLAEAFDRLPNGFPRTPLNTEIPLLKRIFTPDEASLAAHMTRKMEDSSVIAERAGR
ncbi:MAG: 4Fe-4S ferredoxin, partial [FCB group bacterium]|nr:4Fe-4S ferredoxin [FCB group bacterium]